MPNVLLIVLLLLQFNVASPFRFSLSCYFQDIVWGSVIGAVIATISYFYYYPPLWDPMCHRPRDADHVGKQFSKTAVPLLPQSVKVM